MGKILIILLFCGQLLAQEFEPIVKVSIDTATVKNACSGVVIGEDTNNYYILSCNHVFNDVKNPTEVIVKAYSMGPNDLSVDNKCKVLKASYRYDLAYFSLKKNNFIKITPVKLAESNLLVNVEATAWGFPFDNPKLTKIKLVVESYKEYKTEGGVTLLRCKESVKSGISGGPLIANNEVYGITSSGDKTGTSFIPAFECHNFLKE